MTESDSSPDRAEQACFEVFFHACPAAAVITDSEGVVVAANLAFRGLVGAVGGSVTGLRIREAAAAESGRQAIDDALHEVLVKPEELVQFEVEIASAEAPGRPVRASVTAPPGIAARRLFLFEDVQELRQLQETFRHQTLHDSLTGLPNAAYFRSNLEGLVATAAGQERIAVLFLDVDGFGVINDGLGREVANEVLRGIAGTLREVFAGHDAFIARLFRDEFAVALHGTLTRHEVVALVEEMIERLAIPVYHGEAGIGVSASVGIVVAGASAGGHDELARCAEVALHRAKDLGKSQWVLFDPDADRVARDRYRLAASLGGAMETGEVGVVYQPHVVLPDAPVVTSLNASLRWRHPELGQLRAAEVYALAELTGMTVPVGKHLLHEAMSTAADWAARFGDGAPMVCLTLPQRMAIDADLVGIVRTELDRHGLEPRRLMLCTDGPSLLDARGDLVESLSVLGRLGVVFVVYVTGLPELELVSALALPVPAVMLTGPIVAGLAAENPPEWARRQVRYLVDRADELTMKVGAHDVVSQAHAELLHSLGVVVAGGPYLPEYASREEAEVWAGRVFAMG
ncbi:diguanylate cyclase domain-containing protein [Lentzea sp. NPDC059081]|uniref:diguanylate cyclase domain-containing protein n=1 Tax=Lentzea sp. NPDC059081 TaxID=3346719 RepID=UPI00368F6764